MRRRDDPCDIILMTYMTYDLHDFFISHYKRPTTYFWETTWIVGNNRWKLLVCCLHTKLSIRKISFS
jgi:hypothetical protein